MQGRITLKGAGVRLATATGYLLARFAGLTYLQRSITLRRSDARHVATRLSKIGLRIRNRSTASIARDAAFGSLSEISSIVPLNAGFKT
jgi:hypothetical protein